MTFRLITYAATKVLGNTTQPEWTLLLSVAGAGDTPSVSAGLLAHPRSACPVLGSLDTLWHAAAKEGSTATLSCLWDASEAFPALRGLVDWPNSRGESPLMAALKLGRGDAAVWLLKHGAQPCRWDAFRRCSTLHLAARGGSEAACVAILSRLQPDQCRAWVNARSSKCHVRPIHYAAALGHVRIVRLLLLHGALLNVTCHRWLPGHSILDMHSKLNSYMTGAHASALHLAAGNGHVGAVAELLYHYHTNASAVGDPRPVSDGGSAELRYWHKTPSQAAAANEHTLCAALTKPGGDLDALLAGHKRRHEVPTLQALAASVVRQGLVKGIDAIQARLMGRGLGWEGQSSAPAGECSTAGVSVEVVSLGDVGSPSRGLTSHVSLPGSTTGWEGVKEEARGGEGSNRWWLPGAWGPGGAGRSPALSVPQGSALSVSQGPELSFAQGVSAAASAADAIMSWNVPLGAVAGGAGAVEEDVGGGDEERCCVCLCSAVELQVAGCRHRMCCECMLTMAQRAVKKPVLCPMCRGPVRAVEQLR